MPFMKKGERERREKVSQARKLHGERNKARKDFYLEDKRRASRIELGRRIMKLEVLAAKMWCDDCDIPLSFRYISEETRQGLASVFLIRCAKCLKEHQIPTDERAPGTSDGGRDLFAINCKVSLGCMDSGFGHESLNKFLSCINIPPVYRNTVVRAQDRVGKHIVDLANESCAEAIQEEKEEVLKKRSRLHNENDDPDDPVLMDFTNTTTTPRKSTRTRRVTECLPPSDETPRRGRVRRFTESNAGESSVELVRLNVKFDFGWDKRGNGFTYDSHSGRGSLIGAETNKVLGYDVVSLYCAKCARGGKPEDHKCMKNYEGSSKGMEPHSAVKLCLKNPQLEEANCIVGGLCVDKDSSTRAALARASTHTIETFTDLNHNTKSFNNALYKLKNSHKWLTSDIISYLKRCLNYAIHQHRSDVEGVRVAIKNIENHVFGEHDICGEWCKAKGDPDYVFRSLPGKKPFDRADTKMDQWRSDLRKLLQNQADEADSLAPCGSTQQNESFNQSCVSHAPKSRHYCGTEANLFRVSTAVCTKNLGYDYISRLFEKATLSPSATKQRLQLEQSKQLKALYTARPDIKRRRLQLKQQHGAKRKSLNKTAGLTYMSGMASAMERAAAATTTSSPWMPEPSALSAECLPVLVDIETTGLSAEAEIVQLAAKCGTEEFSVYMLPLRRFSPEASAVTGLRVQGGALYYHKERVQTTPPEAAAHNFIEFLKKQAPQVVLVGHNIVRFDGPRILKFLKQQSLAREFCDCVHGFTDTLPLIRQGKMQKQDLLAATFLKGPRWEKITAGAHNALTDCILLDGLLEHFSITTTILFASVLTITSFLEKQAQNKRKNDVAPTLMGMTECGVSKHMIGKMAASGVTMEELKAAYSDRSRKGLEVCLGVEIDGKPRVTRTRKVLDSVEAFLKSKL